MDKLVFDGRRVTISNDGATIMKLLEIAHPAAKTLVDISMSQVRPYVCVCIFVHQLGLDCFLLCARLEYCIIYYFETKRLEHIFESLIKNTLVSFEQSF